ncbi:MAG: hypothetical protein U9M90_00755 [Patescibacteria group bacterium]|nr:hypothetical protein [Patescibacteria group bacterium]
MKKLLLLGIVFAVIISISSVFAGSDGKNKSYEFTVKEDGKLKIYGLVAEYPEPPAGVPAEVALKIIQGEIPSYIVPGKSKIHVDRLFWLPKASTQTARTRIMWNGTDWDESKLAPTSKEANNNIYGTLTLIIVGIFATSIISQYSTSGKQNWGLFVFYGALASIVLVALVWFIGKPNIDKPIVGGILIISIGVLIGGLAGILASGLANRLTTLISMDIAFSILAGASTSALAGALALNGQPKMLIQLLGFLLVVSIGSFIPAKALMLASTASKSKRRREKEKEKQGIADG